MRKLQHDCAPDPLCDPRNGNDADAVVVSDAYANHAYGVLAQGRAT